MEYAAPFVVNPTSPKRRNSVDDETIKSNRTMTDRADEGCIVEPFACFSRGGNPANVEPPLVNFVFARVDEKSSKIGKRRV